MTTTQYSRVLVTDFDGTVAREDFYQVFLRRVAPPNEGSVWADYCAGRVTHFDALRLIFGSAAPGEEALARLLPEMEFPDTFAKCLTRMRQHGWDVVIVSAGCLWYIDRLLGDLPVERHGNPGRIVDGRLVLELPQDSPFFSPETGIDKAAVVGSYLDRGIHVAFAGDGHPDLPAALRVPPEMRFARGVLAEDLRRQGERFQPFDRWPEIVETLLARSVE